MSTVLLKEVLAACCECCDRAGHVIRSVHEKRLKDGDGALAASLKDATCERSWATVADTEAQAVVTALLEQAFPGIKIVGEEDDVPPTESAAPGSPLVKSHPSCTNVEPPKRHTEIPLDTITVYVDPVDGTKEFVEGRVENVCTLIGISIRGEAVAGAIGLPFWREENDSLVVFSKTEFVESSTSATISGIVDGTGVGGIPQNDLQRIKEAAKRRADKTAVLSLAASAEGAAGSPVAAARDALCTKTDDWTSPFNLVSIPGAGNKIVSVILGKTDAVLCNLKGSLWDTCATEAVLRAQGGALTDYFGGRFLHSSANPMGTSNKLGAIGCAAGMDITQLWGKLSRTDEVTALLSSTGLATFAPEHDSSGGNPSAIASDIARTIQGVPLTKQMLTEAFGSHHTVQRFAAPDASAVRYKMAECCRLWIEYNDSPAADDQNPPPKSVFVKRSVMRDLMHARAKITSAPHKLARDVRSYAVETSFLGSQACKKLAISPSARNPTTGHVALARALFSECHVEHESLIDSSFCVVLEDFCHLDGWVQKAMLSREELIAAVRSLAKFHAFFWNGRVGDSGPSDEDAVQQELDASVWDSGCYWSPKRQAPDQIDKLCERFKRHSYVDGFAEAVAEAGGPTKEELVNIPEKLTRLAKKAARESHLYLSTEGGPADAFADAGSGTHPKTGAETQTLRSKQHKHRTLIHGDLKAANMFFKNGPNGDIEVGFIDYQWSGWGLGAVDLAYLMCAAAGPSALDVSKEADVEKAVLREYHTVLCEALAEFGAAADADAASKELISFDELFEEYELALLDHSVTVFSYLWDGLKASPAVLEDRGKKHPMTANAVNKSTGCAAWLLSRIAYLVQKYES